MKHPNPQDLEEALDRLACPTTKHAAIIMAQRDEVGRQRYGQDVDENPLTAAQWADHAVEEAADGLKYAIRAREEARKLQVDLDAFRTANAALVEKVKWLEEIGDKLSTAFDKEWLVSADIESIQDEWDEAKGQP